MDFLDPRRKKAHRRRLIFGYALMSILIGIGTMTLLYLSYGFDVDRETGQLIQNGIVFVDSKPQGSSVYLDNMLQPNTTDTRLDIPAGNYTIRLENDGYRNWQRSFSIDGGQFQRLVYPLLIPNVLETSDVNTYNVLPLLSTQSPDRRWILVQRPTTVYQFDMYNAQDPQEPSELVQMPIALLTNPTAEAELEFVEWSNDNRHVLIKRTYDINKTEYIMLDREKPGESVNLNKTLGIAPTKITLRDKKYDQFYFLDKIPGTLRSASTKDRTISAPLAKEVYEYSTYGGDTILFATTDDADKDAAEIRILEKDKTYKLREVAKADNYVLDISRYDGEWYYVAGGSSDGETYIYEDPLKSLKDDNRSLKVVSVIRLDNPRYTNFSANTQFISVQSGNEFIVYDLEDRQQYHTELDQDIKLNQKLKWMDGHRFVYVVNHQSYVIDFDGSNKNTLVTSMGVLPYFDRDYDNVFTLEGSKTDPTKQALTITKINIDQ